MTLCKRQNIKTVKQISGWGKGSMGGMNRWISEDFKSSENTMHDTVMIDIHYIFVQNQRIYNSKSER